MRERERERAIGEGRQAEQVIMLGAPKGGNSSLWKLKLQLAGGKLMNYGQATLKEFSA